MSLRRAVLPDTTATESRPHRGHATCGSRDLAPPSSMPTHTVLAAFEACAAKATKAAREGGAPIESSIRSNACAARSMTGSTAQSAWTMPSKPLSGYEHVLTRPHEQHSRWNTKPDITRGLSIEAVDLASLVQSGACCSRRLSLASFRPTTFSWAGWTRPFQTKELGLRAEVIAEVRKRFEDRSMEPSQGAACARRPPIVHVGDDRLERHGGRRQGGRCGGTGMTAAAGKRPSSEIAR